MKKLYAFLLIMLCATAVGAQDFPFKDASLDLESRVEDLLSRLTMDEKLGMMEHRNPAIPSLGLPAYSWWNEALHGVARNGYATVWPMPIALAATFNTPLVFDIFSEVALEANRKYMEARTADTCVALREPTDYTGLTFFTPNINIFRDPRWGRGMETYGEDPHLTATMGLACVNGLQHSHMPYKKGEAAPLPLTTAACVKHLAVHSGPEGVRHEFDSRVDMYDMKMTYLPAFEYIIKNSDVQQVMCGYNRLNGVPCCTNKEMLLDLLRNEWKYDGIVVTDCWALNDCWERDTVIPRHKTHASAALTAADAFGSEVDLECGSGLQALRTAVDSGWVDEKKVNEHVRRILRTRLRTELADNRELPLSDMNPTIAASETLVLLRNEKDLLPLKQGTRIFLAGPNAEDTLMPQGNYNGTPRHTVSIREGLEQHFTLVSSPKEAEVIVYAGGLNPQLEGEELPVEMPGFLKGDRTLIELPANQNKELHRLQRMHRPVVLLLCSGSAIALDRKAQQCAAIMACWYGGENMGQAISESMAGMADRFGRLPLTFYKSTKQLPQFDDYNMEGRTYRYMTQKPLYPFGYGLNYRQASVDYRWYQYKSGEQGVRCTVKTAPESWSQRLSDSTVSTTVLKVYIVPNDKSNKLQRTLVGYKKVELQKNDFDVNITIDPFWLRQYNPKTLEMEPMPEGSYQIIVEN
ncbi:MAG: glycoside hydrolase family 3 C-terminal domain-containing protein [Bacteroidales bacterium]|nr:glycoside hydrolase family 3 C-terminal domain-containing protein [Bacteroidales bacterium]